MTGTSPVKVQGSLPVTDDLTVKIIELQEHFTRFPEFGLPALLEDITLRQVEDEDWAEAWKKYFKPLRIGKSIIIKPSWEYYEPKSGDVILELDPGMAFGTGTHPTTKLCLEALERLVQPGMVIADIGTGSGILSLAAAKLGAKLVYATDTDPLPLRIAAQNIARNELNTQITLYPVPEFNAAVKECDLIVANIVANTIIELAPSIPSRLKSEGLFISCGIVNHNMETVLQALEAVGLEHVETYFEDIWVCLITRLPQTPTQDEDSYRQAMRELPPLGSELDAWSS